jgi:hypothetical protein
MKGSGSFVVLFGFGPGGCISIFVNFDVDYICPATYRTVLDVLLALTRRQINRDDDFFAAGIAGVGGPRRRLVVWVSFSPRESNDRQNEKSWWPSPRVVCALREIDSVSLFDVVISLLLGAILVLHVFMLRRLVRCTDATKRTNELGERLVQLGEQSITLQHETNRLLKKIVFEEDDGMAGDAERIEAEKPDYSGSTEKIGH